MQSDEHERPPSDGSKYLRYYHIGLQFFVGVGLFTFGGIWLDRKLGTQVLFTLLGLCLGFAGSLRSIYSDIYGEKKNAREGRGEIETSGGEDAKEGSDKTGPGSA